MKKLAIGVASFFGGWFLATTVVVFLSIAGLNIPLALARNSSQFNSYQGAEILLLMIVFGWAFYRVLVRRFVGPEPEKVAVQAFPHHTCGNCGKPLSPVWFGKCEHCGASYAEHAPVSRVANGLEADALNITRPAAPLVLQAGRRWRMPAALLVAALLLLGTVSVYVLRSGQASANASGELQAVKVETLTCYVASDGSPVEVPADPNVGCPDNGVVASRTVKWVCPAGMFPDRGTLAVVAGATCWGDGEECVGDSASYNESPEPFVGRRGLNMFGMAACLKSGYEPVGNEWSP